MPAVHAICEDVRTRGLDAIRELAERFDGVAVDDIRVARRGDAGRLERLDPDIRAGLEESIRRLRATCANELEQDAVTDLGDGARVTHRKVPVDRVGLYVPGGLAPLVSSVLMNAVPAQTAGVGSIALASPPQKEFGGSVAPHDPRGLRAARGRGGVRRRRRPGDRDVRLRRRPVRQGRPGDRARQHLDGHGQAAAQGPGRHRLRGRSDARSRSWPTTPRTRRTSPPTWSARPSTTRWRPPCS